MSGSAGSSFGGVPGHVYCTNCNAKCADKGIADGIRGAQAMYFFCPNPTCQKRTQWKMLYRRDGCPNPKCWYKQYSSFPRWGDKARKAREEARGLAAME